MKELKERILELLDYSNEDPKADGEGFEGLRKKVKEQDRMMNELKELARASNTLLGRTIQFQMADSYALYIITKVNKKTVELSWIDYCDGWVDDRLGYLATIPLEYATQKVTGDDKLAELFS